MSRHAEPPQWKDWNVAITGINARPDNPGPGCAVARCLRHASGFRGRIIGLAYATLDAGLYLHESCDSGHLLPYPASGTAALLERLDELLCRDRIDAVLPCLDAELANFIAAEDQLRRRGIRLLLPQRAQLRRRDKDRLPALCADAGGQYPVAYVAQQGARPAQRLGLSGADDETNLVRLAPASRLTQYVLEERIASRPELLDGSRRRV